MYFSIQPTSGVCAALDPPPPPQGRREDSGRSDPFLNVDSAGGGGYCYEFDSPCWTSAEGISVGSTNVPERQA